MKELFKSFVKLCRDWDLVGDEVISFDGTKIKANNNRYRNYNRTKLDNKLQAIDEKIQKYLDDMDTADRDERLERLNKNRAIYEDIMRRLEESGENQISTTDPDAVLMENKKGGLEPGYNVQSAVDGKYDIVVEVETNRSCVDQGYLGFMVEKVQENSANKEFYALADRGYWQGRDLEKVESLGVKSLVAPQRNSPRKTHSPEYTIDKFQYNHEANEYICPRGERLSSNNSGGRGYRRYFNKEACARCEARAECVKVSKLRYKMICRSQYAEVLETVTKRMEENKALYHRRQELSEHPFGTVKRTMNGGYYLLRTLPKVTAEGALMFLGYNIKRVINVLGFYVMMGKMA
jgi:hypothetical protein